MRIEEVFYEDERVVSMVSRLKFPDDCAKAPDKPGVCLVESPNGCRRAFASANLSATISHLGSPNRGPSVWQVIGDPGLSTSGTLHFFTTSDLKDAEALKETILSHFSF